MGFLEMLSNLKGQLSLYIIVAVVIVAVFSVYRTTLPAVAPPAKISLNSENEHAAINEYLEACFQDAASSSLLSLEYEGSADSSLPRIPLEDDNVAVLVHGESATIPPLSTIEKQLALELLSTYSECKPSLLFPFEIAQDFENAQSIATLTERNVQMSLHVPTRVRIGVKDIISLGDHRVIIPSNLFALHSFAIKVAKEIADNPGLLPLHAIASGPYPTFIYPYSDKSIIVRIVDPEPFHDLDETPQTYTFGVTEVRP